MKRRLFASLCTAAVLGFAVPAHAAEAVDTGSTPVVSIAAGDVDVKMEGWSKKRVEITRTDLGDGWKAVLEQKGSKITVRFEGVGVPLGGTLSLRVPKQAEIRVTTRDGDVDATAQEGNLRITTLSGRVDVSGAATRADVRTTSGSVHLSGLAGEAELTTVSGKIEVEFASGRVRAKTVSGDVAISASALERLVVASVSGAVAFVGDLKKGRHEIDSHSGEVSISLPKKAAFSLRARSFSGKIEDRALEPVVVTKGRYARQQGDDGADLDVSTFGGDIVFMAH